MFGDLKSVCRVKERYDIFNICQRGIGNPNPIKLGRCIKELERIYGIQHGATSFQGNQHNEVSPKISESPNQEQLAEMIGISVDTLNNYKKLTELIPELEDLVDAVFLHLLLLLLYFQTAKKRTINFMIRNKFIHINLYY